MQRETLSRVKTQPMLVAKNSGLVWTGSSYRRPTMGGSDRQSKGRPDGKRSSVQNVDRYITVLSQRWSRVDSAQFLHCFGRSPFVARGSDFLWTMGHVLLELTCNHYHEPWARKPPELQSLIGHLIAS